MKAEAALAEAKAQAEAAQAAAAKALAEAQAAQVRARRGRRRGAFGHILVAARGRSLTKALRRTLSLHVSGHMV